MVTLNVYKERDKFSLQMVTNIKGIFVMDWWMVKDNFYGRIGWNTQGHLWIMLSQAKESMSGRMVAGTKGICWMVSDMGKESISVQKMVPNIMVIGFKVWDMVKACYNLLKTFHMKGNFNMVFAMEREKWNILQETFTKGIGKTIKSVDMG